MATAPIVTIEGLSKSYGKRLVVDSVDAEVRPGEVLGLLGPNGAGKTTVIKCLLGLVRPDAGTIRIGGVPLHEGGARARALLGYVPQKTDLGDGLTGAELLQLAGRLRLLGPRDIDRAVQRAGADGLLGAPLDTLSGGQMQRVLLAQALLGDPPLLVFDEPTVSLDPLAQHEYIELVQSMRDEGARHLAVFPPAWRGRAARRLGARPRCRARRGALAPRGVAGRRSRTALPRGGRPVAPRLAPGEFE